MLAFPDRDDVSAQFSQFDIYLTIAVDVRFELLEPEFRPTHQKST
jgi:hypothetical protein